MLGKPESRFFIFALEPSLLRWLGVALQLHLRMTRVFSTKIARAIQPRNYGSFFSVGVSAQLENSISDARAFRRFAFVPQIRTHAMVKARSGHSFAVSGKCNGVRPSP